jgi:hypothetical protein
MIKGLFLGLLLTTATGTCAVQAQSSDSDNAGPASRPTDTGLLNKNYLTSTGETVPRPGKSGERIAAPSGPVSKTEDRKNPAPCRWD